ncbi:MAG: hypothetical protein IPJ41_15360 [Phycisphaerales bacterium]|nr:hypothetical protein [Phycisphaerales bacterium]
MTTKRPNLGRTLRRSAGVLALWAGAAVAVFPASAWGQGASGESGRAAVDPLDLDGRTFGGLRVPLSPVAGVLEFSGRHARVWVEQGAGSGPVQRLLLDGDVSVTLGGTTLTADRAAVWIERLGGGPGEAKLHQVWVYFDGVGSLGADAGSAIQANRLSVDGVVMSADPVRLAVDLAEQGRPNDAFVRESEREFTRYLRELAMGRPVELEEVAEAPAETGNSGGRYAAPEERDILLEAPVVADAGTEIFAKDGIITFDPGQIALVNGEEGRSLLLTDGVKVLYQDTKSSRRLQMQAERAVVFLSPGTIAELAQFKPEDVQGIYLEGGVTVTDGQYTLRGPKVYYDVSHDRAMLVDAVFWTYDQQLKMPLYVRADSLRQESAKEFVAKEATVANTRFAHPHMSIGAREVTVKRYTRSNGTEGNHVDAEGLTARAGPVPFFYWPNWRGDPERFPIRDLRVESSSRTGPAWMTAWDVATLLGLDRPEGFDTTLLVDYYNERGFAVGTQTTWETEQMKGGVFAYLLFHDTGEDVTTTGRRVDLDGDTRGMLLAENRWRLGGPWTLTTELSTISDPRLVDALFNRWATERREFTTRARLDRTDENSQLSLEAKTNLDDFISNQWLLESRGYSVDKLPELSYVRTLDDIGEGWAPGVLTLSSEYRLGQLAMNFSDPAVQELGFTNKTLSQAAFGIDPAQSIADSLRAQGLREAGVVRLDTRHEVDAVLDAGPIRVNPFVVGRATAYDEDFDTYSPTEDDNVRLWGAAGVRFSTSLQRVDNSVESEMFDLHRIRHIVEPGVTVWHAGSTVDRVYLPVYDDAVESLAEGTMVRVGVNQTWQTMRGGPGRWRDVDVFKLNVEYVWASGDTDRESPIGRWYEARPELSSPGEFVDAEALWQVSDPVGVTGRIVYDVDNTHQPAYSTAGLLIDHGGGLRSSIGQRFVNALDSTLVFYTLDYSITDKYDFSFDTNYDTTIDKLERVSVSLSRSYPNLVVGLAYSYNNITDESSIGFILSPRGLGGGFGVRTGGRNERGSELGG